MSAVAQVDLSDYQAGKTIETVTKTVICKLETSDRKNAAVRGVIDNWQAIAGRMADLMPSFGPSHWRSQDTMLSRVVRREFPNHGLRAHDAYQAAYKVGEAYGSWHSNYHEKLQPSFGDGNYARFCHCGVSVERNGRGFGVKVNLRPRKPIWWHVAPGEYQYEWLNKIDAGEVSTGSFELHLRDNGDLFLHLSIRQEVEVYHPSDVPQVVGVDLGERALYAAAVVSNSGVEAVEVEPGREFRHYRERLKQKRSELMGRGDLRGVKQCGDEHRRYTDHITHVASRKIVDLASEYAPCSIALEKLTGYRSDATDAIHDWPFAEIQTKIAYKATEAGIPVVFVDPAGTSYTCSECGSAVPENRNGVTFHCRRCGYEVHADVNAAKNITARL